MRTKSIILLFVWFSFAFTQAQNQPTKSTIQITQGVGQAIQSALQKSAELRNKQIEIEKISNQRKEVWQKYIPRIEANALYNYVDTDIKVDLKTKHTPLLNIPIFDGSKTIDSYSNTLIGEVKATAVIFSGLQIPYGAKALENKEKGLKELAKVNEDDLIIEVITSFDKINLLDSLEQLIKGSEKRLEAETKRVEAALKEGFAIPSDKDKIKMAQLELESKRVELEGNRNLLFQKLNYLTGLSSEEIRNIKHNFEKILLFDTGMLSAENKPELKALQFFKKAQEYVVKKERASFLPQMQAMGGYRYASIFNSNFHLGDLPNPLTGGSIPINMGANEITANPMWFVGVGVKWKLFDGFERSNKIHTAKLDLETLENKYADAQEKLHLLLNKQLEQYSVEVKKLALSEQKVKVAKNSLDVDIKRYNEGFININDRLAAENDYYKAVSEYTKQLIDERKAALEVMKVSGGLEEYQVK